MVENRNYIEHCKSLLSTFYWINIIHITWKKCCKISGSLASSICCHWTLWYYLPSLLPAFLFSFKGLCLFAPLKFSSEELSFTTAAETQIKKNKKLSWSLHIFIPFSEFTLQDSASIPKPLNYSLDATDPKKPFLFQNPFPLSLNPFFLLIQYLLEPPVYLLITETGTQKLHSAHLCGVSCSSTSLTQLQ